MQYRHGEKALVTNHVEKQAENVSVPIHDLRTRNKQILMDIKKFERFHQAGQAAHFTCRAIPINFAGCVKDFASIALEI